MKHFSKIFSLFLSAFIIVIFLTACRSYPFKREIVETAAKKFRMYEPVYLGKTDRDYPEFKLKWKSIPGAVGYEIAFYAEGEDPYGRGHFAKRTTKNDYSGSSEKVVFLQGVYTDTVTYRVKVRPDVRDETNSQKFKEPVWSNIWEIKFTDGEYSISETDADFDEEIAAKEEQDAGGSKKKTNAKPLPHSYPEPLLLFLAKEEGMEEPFSTDDIAGFSMNVNSGGHGNPAQIFEDGPSLEQFKDGVSEITVGEEVKDEPMTTEEGTFYSALDKEGNRLFTFEVYKDRYLEGDRGELYPLNGMTRLNSIEGVMTAGDWEMQENELEKNSKDYEASGRGVLESSYETHILEEAGPESVNGVRAYIDWNEDMQKLNSREEAVTTAVFDALKDMQIVKKAEDRSGQMWHLVIEYKVPGKNFNDSVSFSFEGDNIERNGTYHTVDDIEKLYDAVDCDIFNYLRNYSDAPIIDPKY